jgi:outer membrane receptor protein involved in Fe transport
LACLLEALLLALPVYAQVGGSIAGTVTDSSGAVVPGVALKATNQSTAANYSTISNESGIYRFPALPVGRYDLTASKQGFAELKRTGVAVTVGGQLNLDMTLIVAAANQEVSVSGDLPLVETTRSQVSSTVGDRSIANLPVNGRNFIDFVLLTPGVTLDNRLGDISFAGQRGTLNSLQVDGSDNNNTFFGQTLGRTGSGRAPYQFSQDAVKEFQVNSNAYSAEYGHAAGAVINVVTKSGGNQFHGTGFWYYRDRSMNANDAVNKLNGRPKSPYHFNQFGGNFGGPIVKDKAFFFFDYDGQRNTLPNTVILNLPAIAAPDAYQQAAIDYLTQRANSWTRTQNQNTYMVKVDWIVTPRNQLSVRWNRQSFIGNGFENGGPTNSFEHTGASNVFTDTVTGQLTSTLTPTVVNELRASFVRDREPGLSNSINPEATVLDGGQTLLTVGRNFFSPRETTIQRGEWGDTVSMQHGRHGLKFGANMMMDRILNFFPGNFSGQYRFNSLESFGHNLLGVPAPAPGDTYAQAFAGTGTTGATTHPNLLELSFFAQDDWRVNEHLTLNLGLRYDNLRMAQPPVKNPSAALAAAGIDTSRIPNDNTEFGPRIGIAYRPTSSDRLVIRAGYGIFYGRTPSIMIGTAHSNNGVNVQTLTFTGTAIPQYPNTECGAPVASPSCAAPTGGSSSAPIIFVFSPKYRQPYTQQYSAGVEYALARNMSLAVSYLGVKGVNLQRTRDINLAGPETPTSIPVAGTGEILTYDKITQPRPIAGFSRIEQFESTADSRYNGLTVQLNKRFSNHFQFLAAYTLGKVTDDNPDATAVVPFSFDDAKMVADPLNPKGDTGPGINDQRHRLVLSGVWTLDYANKMSSRAARALLGGWELSGILNAQSGQPYTAMINSDLNKDGNSRNDRAPGFARDTFYNTATWSFSPRLTRTVNLTERAHLQFIGEAFNAFNAANYISRNNTYYSPGTCSGSACLIPQNTGIRAFGVPNTSSGPRIVQVAVKFLF